MGTELSLICAQESLLTPSAPGTYCADGAGFLVVSKFAGAPFAARCGTGFSVVVKFVGAQEVLPAPGADGECVHPCSPLRY